MAVRDYLPKWFRRLVAQRVMGALVGAVDEVFDELTADRLQGDANTVIAEANDEGLARLGKELATAPRPGSSSEQYRDAIAAVKQGDMVSDDAYRRALDRWGYAYQLLEMGDQATMWDRGFYDTASYPLTSPTVLIIFADPFVGVTPTSQQKAIALQAMKNANADAWRIKGRGVQLIATYPASLA